MQLDGNVILDLKAKFAHNGNKSPNIVENMGCDFMNILKDMSSMQMERNSRDFHNQHQQEFLQKKPNMDWKHPVKDDVFKKEYHTKEDRTDESCNEESVVKKSQVKHIVDKAEATDFIKNAEAMDFIDNVKASNFTDNNSITKELVTVEQTVTGELSCVGETISNADMTIKADDAKNMEGKHPENLPPFLKSKLLKDEGSFDFKESSHPFMELNALVDNADESLNATVEKLKSLSPQALKELSNDLQKARSELLKSSMQDVSGETKNISAFKNDLNPQQFLKSDSLQGMLAELNGKVEYVGNSKLVDVSKNLALNDFENIEKSINASLKIKNENVEAKLESLTENKILGKEQSLARSLEVLKMVSQGNIPQDGVIATRRNLGMSTEVGEFSIDKGSMGAQIREAIRDIGAFSSNFSGSQHHQSHSQSGGQQFYKGAEPLVFGVNHLNSMDKVFKEANVSQNTRFEMLSLSSNLRENAEALTNKVMEMAARNLKNVELTINPEGMGKIKISIDASINDEIQRISIAASSSNTRGLLEGGMASLKEMLASYDIDCKTTVEHYENEDSDESNHFAEHEEGRESKQEKQDSKSQHEEPQDTVFLNAKSDDNEDDKVLQFAQENTMDDDNNYEDGSISYFA